MRSNGVGLPEEQLIECVHHSQSFNEIFGFQINIHYWIGESFEFLRLFYSLSAIVLRSIEILIAKCMAPWLTNSLAVQEKMSTMIGYSSTEVEKKKQTAHLPV